MFKIAICDDEAIFAKKIEAIVAKYMEQSRILYEIDIFNSGNDFAALGVRMIEYKVVFLDINMEQLDGIETAKIIRGFSDTVFIVFVTAYINYTLEGYKVAAIRYLLKDREKFTELIYECMDAILHKMNYVVAKKEIRFNEGKKMVPLERLLYIESKLHKLEFHVIQDGIKVYTIYDTLNNIEKEYSSYDFIRTHQSFLVNLKHIRTVERYKILLTTGMTLSIPKARYKLVEEAYVAYRGEI